MIILTLRIVMDVEKRDEVKKLFGLYFGPVSVQPGCNNIGLYANCMRPEEFLLIEEWESWKFIRHHVRSLDFQNVLDIIDLAKEPPEIRFHSASFKQGFEMVEDIRKDNAVGYQLLKEKQIQKIG